MNDAVILNETFLTTEYVKRSKIEPQNVTVVGRHPFARRLSEISGIPVGYCRDFSALSASHGALWYVLDLTSPDPDELKSAVELCSGKNLMLLCIILMKDLKANPPVQRYAEMELIAASHALKDVCDILRGTADVKAVVLDRLIGAEFDDVGFGTIIKEAECGAVTFTNDMAQRYASFLYLPDAISAVLTVAAKGKPGNLYNATSFYLSEFDFRSKLFSLFGRHGVTMNLADDTGEITRAALDNGKLRSLGWEPVCTLDEMLRYTIPAYTEQFDVQSDYITDSYSGRLPILRQIQLAMLREIDRICRAHGIRYFLSGGSMLGAVRHGGYIPWDDDIDVAFLREEYVKFKSVAPAELNERFSYQSWTNGDGYHYFFDRITAKDTYFASKYSDVYEMPKGISVDIFVYDAVPDSVSTQRRHWKSLMRKRLFMNVRWRNEPRGEGKARLISKLLLPLLRLKSMDGYSASYDKATRRYEGKETATVMAPATDHNWHDCMPRAWFADVVPCRFEDVDTFLPQGYDGFLRNWYGENYMTMLPLAQQQPYHDYYRLDVGSYADEKSDIHFAFSGEIK